MVPQVYSNLAAVDTFLLVELLLDVAGVGVLGYHWHSYPHPYGNHVWLILLMTLTFTLFASNALWNSVIPGGWSIQLEVSFYVLFVLIKNYSAEKLLIFSIIFNLVNVTIQEFAKVHEIHQPIFAAIINAYLRLGLGGAFQYFVLGMIGARFFSQKNFSFNKNIVSRFTLLFFVFIITTLFTNSHSGKQASVLCCVGLLLLLSRILEGNKITSSIFSSLGKYSYFIYFFHFFVLQAMSNLLLTDVNRIFRSFLSFIFLFLVTIGISYLVGKLSWKFFEFPLIKYVHRKFE